MHTNINTLQYILKIAESHKDDAVNDKWKVYSELKRKLHAEFLFGFERDLAETLAI